MFCGNKLFFWTAEILLLTRDFLSLERWSFHYPFVTNVSPS